MPERMTMIRIPASDRDSLKSLKFRIMGEIGQDFNMGELVGVLITLGERHTAELTRLARERIKK